ncbi:MAG: acetyl/propionyl/methylcrotonyl-CoA carboxylase subunit alpha [Gammaproteobacteria bacterium]
MFSKILIANRGEIACRILRTAQDLGIRCIAIYSAADAQALHVQLADEAYLLGPAPSRESYLNIEKILQIAQHAGAEAIHPGYGFLSENADFAEACIKAGICFIGPPAAVIRLMGLKNAAKQHMQQAGVPIIPGYLGTEQTLQTLQNAATEIGYPLLIKAAAGGGGKGMRLVQQASDFAEALASAQREAKTSFGDDRVLLEKYLQQPRHIEVQVMADHQGNVVHIFERDCSIQRRHQKIIEETPAPHLTPTIREQICAAAVAAAKAVGYVNAGTVEMLLDQEQHFYFMEMNTRLQVEHPITEMISGLDLVEWQLRIASGELLPLQQSQIQKQGHALEARIYAEDPQHNFLPATGKIVYLQTPDLNHQVRLDSGIAQGDTIGVYYEALLAKLIVWDTTREAAVQRLQQALRQFRIVGVTTNLDLLQAIVQHPAFFAGQINTFFIEQYAEQLLAENSFLNDEFIAFASLWVLLSTQLNTTGSTESSEDAASPWCAHDAWRLNANPQHHLYFHRAGREIQVRVVYQDAEHFDLYWENRHWTVSGSLLANNEMQACLNGIKMQTMIIPHKNALHIFWGEHHAILYLGALPTHTKHHDEVTASLTSPMPGMVVAILVEIGQKVKQGDALVVIEAMKMENTLYAPRDGVVAALHCQTGDSVQEGAELLLLDTH